MYCILRKMMNAHQDEYGVTVNHLLYYSTNKTSFTRNEKEICSAGLNELIEVGLIKKKHDFGVMDKLLDLSALRTDKGTNKKFVIIDFDEMLKIISKCGSNKFSLLRYFILLIGTFSSSITVYINEREEKRNAVSTVSIDYLCKLTSLSKSTILNYNKILEELKLLYIYHAADYYRVDEHTIKSPANVYGRYCDKVYIDKYVDDSADYKKYENYTPKSKAASNHKRRLSQRYNQIIAGSTKYSMEEIREVYDHIVSQNKYYQTQYNGSKWESFKEKIRDVSKLEEILKLKEKYIIEII